MKNFFVLLFSLMSTSIFAQGLPSCQQQFLESEKHLIKKANDRVGDFYRFSLIKSVENSKFSYTSLSDNKFEVTFSYTMELESPAPLKYTSTRVYAKAVEVYFAVDQVDGGGCAIKAADSLEGNLIFSNISLVK
ncbi:MAG: hypothetical protein ACOVP4_13500 [Bacteriovoracaceae bacterium]|jgi:hypothetical protein